MSNTIETEYGTATAEELPDNSWMIDLFPKKLSDRRPLYKAVDKRLRRAGFRTSILQQRGNRLRMTAWKVTA